MDALMQALESYGYWGMTIAAFLAGSVFPFSSEAVMVSLQLAGLEPWPLFLCATVGNVAGSMFNYWVGTFGRMEWIEKYLRIPRVKIEKTRLWMDGRGAWIGALCFLPILGSVLSVTLGYMRANPYVTLAAIFAGKSLRYAILIISIYYLNN